MLATNQSNGDVSKVCIDTPNDLTQSGRNIKLTIAYDGTNYHGWQIQPNQSTVQATINRAISQIMGHPVSIIGAGRTDTGVHATGQVANFVINSDMPTKVIQRAVNANLPEDIVISEVLEVEDGFHARFSATRRCYQYTMLNRPYPCPFRRKNTFFIPNRICLEQSESVCQVLIGQHNYAAFQKRGSDRISPVCNIFQANLNRIDDLVVLTIQADAFLRGMVRAIVGTILVVLRCQNSTEEMKRIIATRNRSSAGTSAPAKGLTLTAVKYD